jgi:hypothetical protein
VAACVRELVVCLGALWYDEGFRASGNNSVVECDLAKVEVAGSNPVSRSIFQIVGDPCTPTSALRYASANRLAPLRAR